MNKNIFIKTCYMEINCLTYETLGLCSSDNFWSVIFSSSLKTLEHITSQVSRASPEQEQIILLHIMTNFLAIFVLFLVITFVFFIIFISIFDEVSNFLNRILTNQKQEFVIRNCQWNCILGKEFFQNAFTEELEICCFHTL